jgi:hypothetical protein
MSFAARPQPAADRGRKSFACARRQPPMNAIRKLFAAFQLSGFVRRATRQDDGHPWTVDAKPSRNLVTRYACSTTSVNTRSDERPITTIARFRRCARTCLRRRSKLLRSWRAECHASSAEFPERPHSATGPRPRGRASHSPRSSAGSPRGSAFPPVEHGDRNRRVFDEAPKLVAVDMTKNLPRTGSAHLPPPNSWALARRSERRLA